MKGKRTAMDSLADILAQTQTGKRKSRAGTHLANERTLLAYVRTAIALISFGITINRFSLYLMQNEVIPAGTSRTLLADTENLGLGMVVAGIILALAAVIRYMRVEWQIEKEQFVPDRLLPLFVSSAVIVSGIFSVVWLFTR